MNRVLLNRKNIVIAAAVAIVAVVILINSFFNRQNDVYVEAQSSLASSTKMAILAGGCFWCVESDFEKLPGVIAVISGYSGGAAENPNYGNYSEGGHREVVEVTYDPARVSFADLVEYLIKHSDPTDQNGSFYDRGKQYSPAVYYSTEEERKAAFKVFDAINKLGVYEKPLALELLPIMPFYPAEEYHQDYARNNYLKYSYYRNASGRDGFIQKHWGENTVPSLTSDNIGNYQNFNKPPEEALREQLTPLQYQVTQENGTEQAFDNEYWNNEKEGIYVDIISGEPLFSSLDKFDSGTGWPSFTKPLEPANVVLLEDNILFYKRVEVRSRFADSHLGHIFKDGPPEKGGLRYCMNSAALRFIAKEDLEEQGYGQYLSLFKS